MTHHDLIPPNPATQSCHRILKVMDRLEDRLLRLVDDEEEDPDFVRLSKGVGTLAQLQATYARRDERNESVGEKAREARSQATGQISGLGAVRLTDSDRRRMDADAARLAQYERGPVRASNDNRSRLDVEAPPVREDAPRGTSAGHKPLVMPETGPRLIHSETDRTTYDRPDPKSATGRAHPAGREPDTPDGASNP